MKCLGTESASSPIENTNAGQAISSFPRNLFQVKIRTRFSFGAVEDPKWIVIGTAIFQAGFSPDGTRFSTRRDHVTS
jgi:hypothetical protein